MARLYRPHIPLDVRCRVVLRQLGEIWPEEVIAIARGHYGELLQDKLKELAELLKCKPRDLHLDHDPALGARQQVTNFYTEEISYIPEANDPEFLIYREKEAHKIKTNVRGEHGQYPDRVLIKRERRRIKKRKKIKRKWASRPFPKGRKFRSRHAG